MGAFQLESVLISKTWLAKTKYKASKRKNLNKQENQAIRDLRHNKDIIIKTAGNGSAKVIMDKAEYIKEVERQLNDTHFHEPTSTGITGEVIQRANLHTHKGIKSQIINVVI